MILHGRVTDYELNVASGRKSGFISLRVDISLATLTNRPAIL
jgi:hypothetical protein